MSDRQKPIVNVRFLPSLAAAARRLAEQDGMSLSAWIRREAARELSRREGVCVTCGQAVAAGATSAPPGRTDSVSHNGLSGPLQGRERGSQGHAVTGIRCACGRFLANAHAICDSEGEGYSWHMFLADVRGDCSRCGPDVQAMKPDIDRDCWWWSWDAWTWPEEVLSA